MRSLRQRLCATIALTAIVVPGAATAQTPAQPAALTASSGASGRAAAAGLPASELSVRTEAGWITWWQSAAPPGSWSKGTETSPLARAVHWEAGAPGVDWGELSLAGSGEAWRTRLVVVRLDPRRVALRLDTAFTESLHADWSLGRAPSDAVVAVNAGQFVSSLPWGWVVLDGRQYLAPGLGPTSSAFVVDTTGGVTWLHGAAIQAHRGAQPAWAFQSYPTLLQGGTVPATLQGIGRGVDVAHRDARLAIGTLRDGWVLVAMTRFDALGEPLGFVPFGLTVPEMAGVMGALGACDAVMLDGGISAQLLIRGRNGAARRWPGVRRVPLALVAVERATSARVRP